MAAKAWITDWDRCSDRCSIRWRGDRAELVGRPVSQPQQVQNRAYFPVRKCINMGGALEAPREGEWGYTITRPDLQAIKAAGFDTIRVPIKWSAHAMAAPPYTIDPAFMARIDESDGLVPRKRSQYHHQRPSL